MGAFREEKIAQALLRAGVNRARKIKPPGPIADGDAGQSQFPDEESNPAVVLRKNPGDFYRAVGCDGDFAIGKEPGPHRAGSVRRAMETSMRTALGRCLNLDFKLFETPMAGHCWGN